MGVLGVVCKSSYFSECNSRLSDFGQIHKVLGRSLVSAKKIGLGVCLGPREEMSHKCWMLRSTGVSKSRDGLPLVVVGTPYRLLLMV